MPKKKFVRKIFEIPEEVRTKILSVELVGNREVIVDFETEPTAEEVVSIEKMLNVPFAIEGEKKKKFYTKEEIDKLFVKK